MKAKKMIAAILLPVLILSGAAAGVFITDQYTIRRANDNLSSLPPPPLSSEPVSENSNLLPSGTGILLEIEGSKDYYLISPETTPSLIIYPISGDALFDGRSVPITLSGADTAGGLSEVRALLKDNSILMARQVVISAEGLEAIFSAFGRLSFENPSPVGDPDGNITPFFPAGKQSLTGYQTSLFLSSAGDSGRDAAAEALIRLLISAGLNDQDFVRLLSFLNSNLMASDRLKYLDYLKELQASGDMIRLIRLQTEVDNGTVRLTGESLKTLRQSFFID